MHSRKTSKSSPQDAAAAPSAGMETMKLTEDAEPTTSGTTSSTPAPSGAPTDKPAKQDKERKDQKKAAKPPKDKPQQGGGAMQKKKQEGPELIGITVKKAEDLSEWYQQVILKGDMLEFTDIPGCYIYQPASYRIWEFVQEFFNERKWDDCSNGVGGC